MRDEIMVAFFRSFTVVCYDLSYQIAEQQFKYVILLKA